MMFVSRANAGLAPTQVRKIIELRSVLAEKFPSCTGTPAQMRLPSGIESFDRCLEGGLPMAALTEVICAQHGTGSGTLIQSLVSSTRSAGKHLALVDACDCFDPDGLTTDELSALLWVRCAGPEQAVKATDLLCRDNNLPLIILDLAMCSPQQVQTIPSTYWYRLQRVAEGNGAAALIFSPVPVVGSAACTLRLTRRFELSALDLLRDQLTARLQMEAVRSRVPAHYTVPARLVG